MRHAALALAILLGGCGTADDEIEEQSRAILARAPIGTAFDAMPETMKKLGYACEPGVKQYVDRKGTMQKAEGHYSCEREIPSWIVCTRRTRVVLLQHKGRLSNILVNAGNFC